MKKRFNDRVTFIEGKDEARAFFEHKAKLPENSIVVYDDYMSMLNTKASKELLETFFSVVTHQRHAWTFFVTHNIFTPNMVAMRRNTQNFILFNVVQDYQAAAQFAQKLVGIETVEIFLYLWKHIVSMSNHGWIRYDLRMRGTHHNIVSSGGVTADDGAVVYLRSGRGDDSALYIDPTAASYLSRASTKPVLTLSSSSSLS